MKGAIRLTVLGPLVIVDDTMEERVPVAPGVERGPLTAKEKALFMPKPRPFVNTERQQAKARSAMYAAVNAQTRRIGSRTPPKGWTPTKRQREQLERPAGEGYSLRDLMGIRKAA